MKTVLHFQVAKNSGTFVMHKSIFIKFMSPRDLVGEINGEYLRHIKSDINAHTAFERNCFPFLFLNWEYEVVVSAVIDLNYILGQR